MQMLGAKTALAHVLERCRAIPGADIVLCAVPDETADDVLESETQKCGAKIFRGSETDVLSRYAGAARMVDARLVMRVTSDCPLIDPGVCGDLIALCGRSGTDYASNINPRSFPHGLDCEVFTTAALFDAEKRAADQYDREHVTPWIRRSTEIKHANLNSADPRFAQERWTLDYPEDLAFLKAVFERLPADSIASMADVLALLDAAPELRALNANRNETLRSAG